MIQRFLRALGLAADTAAFAEWSYKVWIFLVGLGGFATAATYAAWLTDWINQYGPIAYVGTGILALIIGLIISVLALWVVERWTILAIRRKSKIRGAAVDPMARQYFNERVFLDDIAPPFNGSIANKTFERCQIIGPLNVYPMRTSIERCIYTNVDHIMVDPEKIRAITNARIIDNCIFRDCEIFNISFLINSINYQYFDNSGGCNWVTHTPDPPLPLLDAAATRTED
tara:strand:- start:385 stop:1068 length:684 start_codon:yes stop_codon:yes gene_type:complete